MKLRPLCPECKKKKSPPYTGDNFIEIINEYCDDDLVITAECSQGHKMKWALQKPKFEYFLDCAAEALIDKYPSEACFNFYRARESLFLFATEIILAGYDGLEVYLKTISNSSERIVGAFSALYFEHFKKNYDIEKKMNSYRENIITFRNRIIHKGMIPTYEQTYDYGEIIYSEIGGLITELKTKFRKNIHNHRHNIAKKQFEKNKSDPLGLIASTTMFSISNELSIPPFSEQFFLFEEAVNKLKI